MIFQIEYGMRYCTTGQIIAALMVCYISQLNIVYGQQDQSLAVLDMVGIGISEIEAASLTNRLRSEVVNSSTITVVERSQMAQILEEQDFQLTGCISNECAVEIGQLIGAQQMLAGSFGKLGTAYTIDMRIIDVETGRILKTTSYDIEGSINRLLTEGLEEAIRRIAGIE